MLYKIKEKYWSWGDEFSIRDDKDNVIYKELSCLNTDKQSLEILIDLLIDKILDIKDYCKGVIRYNDEKEKKPIKEKPKKRNNCC